MLITSISLFAVTTFTVFAIFKLSRRVSFISAFIGTCCLLAMFNPLATMIQRPSAEPLAIKYRELEKPTDAIFIAFDYGLFQDFPVWMNRILLFIGTPPEEQRFGFMREENIHRGRFFESKREIENFFLIHSGNVYIAVCDREIYKLHDWGIRTQEVARNGFLVLVKAER